MVSFNLNSIVEQEPDLIGFWRSVSERISTHKHKVANFIKLARRLSWFLCDKLIVQLQLSMFFVHLTFWLTWKKHPLHQKLYFSFGTRNANWLSKPTVCLGLFAVNWCYILMSFLFSDSYLTCVSSTLVAFSFRTASSQRRLFITRLQWRTHWAFLVSKRLFCWCPLEDPHFDSLWSFSIIYWQTERMIEWFTSRAVLTARWRYAYRKINCPTIF